MSKKGEYIIDLSNKVVKWLKPYCTRIKITGSIRRKVRNPEDIDLVLIPKDREELENFLMKKGKRVRGGEHQAVFKIKGVKVELFYTVPEEWGAALLAYSSEQGAEIGLRLFAKRKGFKLSQHGLFKGNKKIAGRTEREIYEALGKKWKKPENR